LTQTLGLDSGDTVALLDCFSGVAGDMWVGAWLDLGLRLADLEGPVASLGLAGVGLHAERVKRGSLAGTHFRVRLAESPRSHRHLGDILAILDRGELPDVVRDCAKRVFQVLGEVEARVHDTPIEHVHFHEVGAEDTIVDVVCAVLGGHLLGVTKIYSSAVVTGRGTVACDHGEMPVPAPGAMGNLLGVPLRSGGPMGECVTPTGAALLKVLVDEFEPDLAWTPSTVGYGAGTRDDPAHPNLLRITLGRACEAVPSAMAEVTCNLDTITGEGLAFLIDGALQRGAVDAFTTPIQMKKGRPGSQFSALVDESSREAVVRFLLEESTSLGVRIHSVERAVVERWEDVVETEFGPVRFKVARLPSGAKVRRPEEEEVLRIVAERGLGRLEVLRRLT
jgi:pyridinium-3,5-bisthiocarboxylic acid mononucleotide nickel chelatase